ncbi:MAG: protein-disulfide reductase DsbD domain-containing protein [Devosia sp.]
MLASPTLGAETEWQSIAPDVRVRLIASEFLRSDGTTLAALEIDMSASTKTYWRVPGETGIGTEIDLAGSVGVTWNQIVWPYPLLETKLGYTDFVYYGQTVLPIELKVEGEKPILRAAVLMGICSDICVPAQANFTLPLDFSAPDRGQGLRINQALALAPLSWDDPREPIGDVTFDATEETLIVPVSDPQIDPLSVIAQADGVDLLFGAPQKSRDGKLVLLPLLGGSVAEGLVGRLIQLTFMTPMGPFELSRRIVPSTPGGL